MDSLRIRCVRIALARGRRPRAGAAWPEAYQPPPPVLATRHIRRDFRDLRRPPPGGQEHIKRCSGWGSTGPIWTAFPIPHARRRLLAARAWREADRHLARLDATRHPTGARAAQPLRDVPGV